MQVEDDETPEMIMAKFAELERIQAAAAAAKAAQPPPAEGQEQGPPLGGAGGDPQQPAAAEQQQQQQQQQQAGAGGGEEGGLTDEQRLEVSTPVGGRRQGEGRSLDAPRLLPSCAYRQGTARWPAGLKSCLPCPRPLRPRPHADQHVQCAHRAGGQRRAAGHR